MLMRLFPSISVTLIKSGSGWNEELWWRWVAKRFAQLLVSAEPDVGGLWDHLICRWAELPELILKISISFLGLLAAHSNWLWSVKVRQPLMDHFSTLDFLCHGNICGSPERDSVELKNINPVDKLFCSGWESVQSSKHPDFKCISVSMQDVAAPQAALGHPPFLFWAWSKQHNNQTSLLHAKFLLWFTF